MLKLLKGLNIEKILFLLIINVITPSLLYSQCGSTINILPYTDNFETLSTDWISLVSGNDDWQWNSGGTPSSGTGPTSGGNGSSSYYFTEASSNFNSTEILNGPCFDFSTAGCSAPQVTFWYHMYGTDMGSLSLEVEQNPGSGTWTTVWTQTGNQGNIWKQALVDLSIYGNSTIRMRFKGVTGSGFKSDMAVDEITVDCAAPVQFFCNAAKVTQDKLYPVCPGTENAEIIGIQASVSGNTGVLNTASFEINMNGTTNINDVDSVKIYYTGLDSNFSTTTLVGSTLPAAGNFLINSNTNISQKGTHYFWVVYDLKSFATINNFLDAECLKVSFLGGEPDEIPNPTTVVGNRKIDLIPQALPLFANGDFENYTSCPNGLSQVNKVVGLSSCTVTSDYYNTCGFNTSSCGAPVNAFSGNGCIGMLVQPWSTTSTNYETTIAQLDNNTIPGAVYDIEFSLNARDITFNSCNANGGIKSCFSFGFYFYKSTNPVPCPGGPFMPIGSQPLPNVSIDGATIPLNSWATFNLTYVADSVYDRVMFGWFPNALAYNTSVCPNNKSGYVYMDALSMGQNASAITCSSSCNYLVDANNDSITICELDSVLLNGTASGGVSSTTWSTSGDGTFIDSTSLNTVYIPGANDILSGNTILYLKSDVPSLPCLQVLDTVYVMIDPFIIDTISSIGTLCSSYAPINLTSNIAGGNWSGNGIIDSINGTFDPSISGAGDWIITHSTSGNCAVQDTVTIQVQTKENALVNYNKNNYCKTEPNPTPNVIGTTGGVFSSSPIGLLIDSISGEISLNASALGVYTITYITSTNQCNDTSTTAIEIISNEDASFSYVKNSYCKIETNPTPIISGTIGGVFSSSSINLVIDTISGEINLSSSLPGTYTVLYTTSYNACKDTQSVIITIIDSEDATFFYAKSSYCENELNPTPNIMGTTGGVFSSSPAGLDIDYSTGSIILATSSPGNYNIKYVTSTSPCSDSLVQQITIESTPNTSFYYEKSEYCIPAEGNIFPTIIGQTGGVFTMNNSNAINSITGEININLLEVGSYSIIYSIDALNCPSSNVFDLEICNNTTYIIPNVLTPNNDLQNDVFKIEGDNIKEIVARIYNRWGETIYTWNNVNGYWDGRTNSGEDCSAGTYFFVIEVIDVNGKKHIKKGHVSLLR